TTMIATTTRKTRNPLTQSMPASPLGLETMPTRASGAVLAGDRDPGLNAEFLGTRLFAGEGHRYAGSIRARVLEIRREMCHRAGQQPLDRRVDDLGGKFGLVEVAQRHPQSRHGAGSAGGVGDVAVNDQR